MKLTSLNVVNFLGIRRLSVHMEAPVQLFCGPNGSGKSSVGDAIRFALLGEPGRVRMKKDFQSLISAGEKSGSVTVGFVSNGEEAAVSRKIKGGEGEGDFPHNPEMLGHGLDASRFMTLTSKERRSLLFKVTGQSLTRGRIMEMARARGCSEELLRSVESMMVAGGLSAIESHAKDQARELKGAWRQITGETWGMEKAESFEVITGDEDVSDPGTIEKLEEKHAALRRKLDSQLTALGEANAAHGLANRVEFLQEKAELAPIVDQNISEMEHDLQVVNEELDRLKKTADDGLGAVVDWTCPECAAAMKLRLNKGRLVQVSADEEGKDHVGDHKKLQTLTAQVADLTRRLEQERHRRYEAKSAREELDKIGGAELPDIQKLTMEVDQTREALATVSGNLEHEKSVRKACDDANRKTSEAAKVHKQIMDWLDIANAMSPEGILSEVMSVALSHVNDSIADFQSVAGWGQVRVTEEMDIQLDGRPYALLSESEQWRADALVAAAIVSRAKTGVLILDRFDVLDLGNRAGLLNLAKGLTKSQMIESIVIMGTLKAPPTLPDGMAVQWLEDGRVASQEKAA